MIESPIDSEMPLDCRPRDQICTHIYFFSAIDLYLFHIDLRSACLTIRRCACFTRILLAFSYVFSKTVTEHPTDAAIGSRRSLIGGRIALALSRSKFKP